MDRETDLERYIQKQTGTKMDTQRNTHTHKIYIYIPIHKHLQIHICRDTYRLRGCTSRDRLTLGQNTCKPSPFHTLTPTLLSQSIQSQRETHMCIDTLGPQTQPCMQSHRDKYTDISMTRPYMHRERGRKRGCQGDIGREKKRHSETCTQGYIGREISLPREGMCIKRLSRVDIEGVIKRGRIGGVGRKGGQWPEWRQANRQRE